MKAMEMKASVLLAHPTPRSWYIAEANRGNPITHDPLAIDSGNLLPEKKSNTHQLQKPTS